MGMGGKSNYYSFNRVGLLSAVLFTGLIFLPFAIAESSIITINDAQYNEMTSEFSVSSSLENVGSSDGTWQALLMLYDSDGFSGTELISFDVNDQENFEVISFNPMGFVMIDNIFLDANAKNFEINAFVMGFEGSNDLKVGLFLQNDLADISVLDFAFVNDSSSNDENLSCDELTGLIDFNMIPLDVGEQILITSGCS